MSSRFDPVVGRSLDVAADEGGALIVEIRWRGGSERNVRYLLGRDAEGFAAGLFEE